MKILFVLVVIGLASVQAGKRPSYPRVNLINRERAVLPKENHPHVPVPRITGGNEAVPHSRPWQVALFVPVDGGVAFCGGFLLNENTVLTAAHCVSDAVDDAEVVLGAHRIFEYEDGQVSIFSSRLVVHENYNSVTLWNDIALIILSEPAPINDIIQPIALPSNTSNTYVDEYANVSGWGKGLDPNDTVSEVLLEVTLTVVSNADCGIFYDLESSQLCATGGIEVLTCSGDSGGALVADGAAIGIASFGVSLGCYYGLPSVFTRVSEHLDWINTNKQ